MCSEKKVNDQMLTINNTILRKRSQRIKKLIHEAESSRNCSRLYGIGIICGAAPSINISFHLESNKKINNNIFYHITQVAYLLIK